MACEQLPKEIETVIVGNGPAALILSYILHGNVPVYDKDSPHPDHILHEKLLQVNGDLLEVDIDGLTGHFNAARFSYSTQALPVNVLLDTLIRPLGETDDAEKKTCIQWRHDPSRAVPHIVVGDTPKTGGQWVDNPVQASWEIGTLSYAGMLSLPGYSFADHYLRRNGKQMPVYLRPSRNAVTDYLAAYSQEVGIAESIHTGITISQVSRKGEGFYIGSHDVYCKRLVLATGIFSNLIPPRPLLQPLLKDSDCPTLGNCDPVLVIGSGFSAADVIISAPPSQRIIHIFKWAPASSPSPLRACHQQAYPEYAGVYRRMKLAARPYSKTKDKALKARQTPSAFDLSRDWKATYEGLPNTEVVDVQVDGPSAVVTFLNDSYGTFQRRVSGLTYVVGRRGSLNYLDESLRKQVVLPGYDSSCVSGQTLREQALEDLELVPNVFIIGSLTGDSLIRFAYGSCTYAAGKIMRRSGKLASLPTSTKQQHQQQQHQQQQHQHQHQQTGSMSDGRSALAKVNGVQTPAQSPRIRAMNGLDGHEHSPVSLAENIRGSGGGGSGTCGARKDNGWQTPSPRALETDASERHESLMRLADPYAHLDRRKEN